MYDVFICYVRTYLDQVTPLHDALEVALRNIYQRGSKVFQDTSDLEIGNRWESEVNTALDQARVMVVVVVPTILESPQCRREMLQFINSPGKHLVPLICERDSHLEELAASVDDHPEGSEAHEIAVCASALREWQEYDFSQAVYQNPNEASYKIAIAELARMIRNKLKYEDQAANAPVAQDKQPPLRETLPREAPRDDSGDPDATRRGDPNAGEVAKTDAGSDGHRRSRAPIVGGILGVIIAIGVAFWMLRSPQPEPDKRITPDQARALLGRVLAEAAGQPGAEHLSFDSDSGTLRIASPPVGKVYLRIELQPAIDPLLQAGLVPGFAIASSAGDTCFILEGDPLILGSDELSDGESAAVRLGVFKQSEARPQITCLDATSTWGRVEARSAVVDSGVIFDAPRDDAQPLRRLRSGQEVQSPFWTNSDVPGWIRMEYRGEYGYFRRELVRELR